MATASFDIRILCTAKMSIGRLDNGHHLPESFGMRDELLNVKRMVLMKQTYESLRGWSKDTTDRIRLKKIDS